jgi:hypothetical protein
MGHARAYQPPDIKKTRPLDNECHVPPDTIPPARDGLAEWHGRGHGAGNQRKGDWAAGMPFATTEWQTCCHTMPTAGCASGQCLEVGQGYLDWPVPMWYFPVRWWMHIWLSSVHCLCTEFDLRRCNPGPRYAVGYQCSRRSPISGHGEPTENLE